MLFYYDFNHIVWRYGFWSKNSSQYADDISYRTKYVQIAGLETMQTGAVIKRSYLALLNSDIYHC